MVGISDLRDVIELPALDAAYNFASHGRLSDGRSPCRHVLTCGDRSDE